MPAGHPLELVGDRLETAGQLAVLAGRADIVQHVIRSLSRPSTLALPDHIAVAVDPALVVDVLGLQPLQVSRALGQLRLQLAHLVGSRPARSPPGSGCARLLRRGSRSTLRLPHLVGLRVDPTVVPDGRSLLFVGLAVRLAHLVPRLAGRLVHDLGVDHVVVGAVGLLPLPHGLSLGAPASAGAWFCCRLSRGVHRLTHGRAGGVDLLHGGLDGVVVLTLERGLQLGQRLLDRLLHVVADLVAVLAEQLLGAEDQVVGLVAELDALAPLPVLLGVRLGLLDHVVDVVLAQGRAAGHRSWTAPCWWPGPWRARARCRWRRCRTRPRSAARRAEPAADRSARSCRATCCPGRSPARPGRPGSSPTAGCRRRW